MNALKGIAAGFVILVLALAIIAGLSSGPGREVFDSVVSAGSTTLQWAATQVGRLSDLLGTRGNSFRSVIAGVILFGSLVLLVPYFRSGALPVFILGAISALTAWVLYNPSILPSVA